MTTAMIVIIHSPVAWIAILVVMVLLAFVQVTPRPEEIAP